MDELIAAMSEFRLPVVREYVNGADMAVVTSGTGQVVALHVFGDHPEQPYCWLLFESVDDWVNGEESYDSGYVGLSGAGVLVSYLL